MGHEVVHYLRRVELYNARVARVDHPKADCASLNVLLNYSQYSDFGVRSQLAKRLPFELSNQGEDEFRRMAGEGATWIASTSSIVALVVIGYSFTQHGPHADFYRNALRIVALVIVLGRLRDCLSTVLMSREEFRKGVSVNLFYDGATLVATVVLLFWMGLMGAVWALLIGEVAALAYVLRHTRFRFERLYVRKTWKRLHESSLLLTVALMDTALITVDQLFLLKFFTKEQYGIYSLGLAFSTIALSLTAIFQTAVQPRVMGLAGEGKHPEAHHVVDASVTMVLIMTLAALAFVIPAVAVVVRFYLPKYRAGAAAYVVLASFALVRGPAILLRGFYLATNSEKRLVTYQACAVATTGALALAVVLRHGSILTMAFSAFAGFAVISVLMLVEFDRRSDAPVSYGKYVILFIGMGSVVAVALLTRSVEPAQRFWPYLLLMCRYTAVSLLGVVVLAAMLRRDLRDAARPFFTRTAEPEVVDVVSEAS